MEPNLVADAKLSDVLEELTRREPIFHRPEFGTTREDFERTTEATRARRAKVVLNQGVKPPVRRERRKAREIYRRASGVSRSLALDPGARRIT